MKETLLSLAVAGTLSASQFLAEVKDFSVNTDAQTLNKEATAIKKMQTRLLSQEQSNIMKSSIQAMMLVNERTYTDFLPTLETSIQRWAKEDKNNLLQAIELITSFLDIRLKQYKNMKNMLNNTDIDKSILNDIATMDKMSRNAKKIFSSYKNQVAVIDSIKTSIFSVTLEDGISIDDFWIPVLEESNNILVKVNGLKNDDFEKIDKTESFLNEIIDSKYIHTIMVA